MGKPNNAGGVDGQSTENMFGGDMGRREAIGGILKLLGLKVTTDAANAMGQEQNVVTVTNRTAPTEKGVITPKESLFIKEQVEGLKIILATSSKEPMSKDFGLVTDFGARLRLAIEGLGKKSIQAEEEERSNMGTLYSKIVLCLKKIIVDLDLAFKKEKDINKKSQIKASYDRAVIDLEFIQTLPGKFQSGEETTHGILIILGDLIKSNNIKDNLGAPLQISLIPKSISVEVNAIQKLGVDLGEKIKEKQKREASFKPTVEVVDAIATLGKFMLNKDTSETNDENNLIGKMKINGGKIDGWFTTGNVQGTLSSGGKNEFILTIPGKGFSGIKYTLNRKNFGRKIEVGDEFDLILPTLGEDRPNTIKTEAIPGGKGVNRVSVWGNKKEGEIVLRYIVTDPNTESVEFCIHNSADGPNVIRFGKPVLTLVKK